jgi:enamine deaminase RidA (YjgF/YER057c/UK114 family)
MAGDAQGFALGHDRGQPYFRCGPEAEAEYIVSAAARLCAAAGTSLSNAVRIQMFLTDLAAFYPVYKVLDRALDGAPIPFSAVEVPSPLPVPGATVLMDIWAYAPGADPS